MSGGELRRWRLMGLVLLPVRYWCGSVLLQVTLSVGLLGGSPSMR